MKISIPTFKEVGIFMQNEKSHQWVPACLGEDFSSQQWLLRLDWFEHHP